MSSLTLPTPDPATPTLEELELDQYVVSGRPFKALLADRQHMKQMIDDAEKAIAEIDTEIMASLDLKGVKTVIWSTDEEQKYLIIRREASKARPILDRSMLLAAGVTPIQLQNGTKFGKPGKGGVTIRRIGRDGHSSNQEAEMEHND